jgi:competence ComEA-like helix-hairpin-helix protein
MAQKGKKQVDINAADEAQLQQIDGINSQRAKLIVEYRESQGPIENWEQLEQLDGIGAKLVEKLRASARLGSGDGDGAGESETEAGAALSLDEDEMIEALTSLAELDGEAAAAYEVASDALDDEDMREKLLEFQQDHLRHVRDLNKVIEEAGGTAVDDARQPDQAFLGRLADGVAALGPKGLLVAMIGNEMLTNGTYMSALDLPCEEPVRKMLEKNYADEQRHLRWLLDAREELGVEFPVEPAVS